MQLFRKARRKMGGLHGLIVGAALLAVSSLIAGAAHAQNMVYHSPGDDGVNPGTPLILDVGPDESLFIWLTTGDQESDAGTEPCNDGNGRELCGYSVTIDAAGSGTVIRDFDPEPGVEWFLSGGNKRLSANGTFSLTGRSGPVRVGELTVSSSEPVGVVMVMGGQAVVADLSIENLPMVTIANTPVPEPTGIAVWLVIYLRRAK